MLTFPVVETDRREGDPAELIAGCERIRKDLDWRPRFDDLEVILRTAWEWERGEACGEEAAK